MKTALSLAVLLAAPAAAIDWNGDPAAAFRVALRDAAPIAAPLGAAVAAPAAAPAVTRLDARPVGDATLFHDRGEPSTTLYFTVNREGDRVGARLIVCASGPGDDNCNEILFHFPQMTYRREDKMVLLDGEPVERLANWSWNQWSNPRFRLVAQRAVETVDLGFERTRRDRWSVHLEAR